MKGDKLIIKPYHRQAGKKILDYLIKNNLLPQDDSSTLAISIAGESGSGKSETAAVVANLCEKKDFSVQILQQDDYFKYPPKTNHNNRIKAHEDGKLENYVGPQEVKLNLLDTHVLAFKNKKKATIVKPLVIYEEDSISSETLTTQSSQIIIAEGTYTSLLTHTDVRVFIDRTYHQTKKDRLDRNRDPATGFIEKVLDIEHQIISEHKNKADLVISPPEE